MKKIMRSTFGRLLCKNWVLAATLICGASVFTSCTNDTSDNPAQEQAKKNRKEFIEHTRATMKDLAENLNFGSWTAANTLNLYFNQYVLNNPDFNKAVLNAFMQKMQCNSGTVLLLRGSLCVVIFEIAKSRGHL